MIDELQKAISLGEELGAHFVEARHDDLTLRTLERTNDVWRDVLVRCRSGLGVTCYFEGASGYAFSASADRTSIDDAVRKAYQLAKATAPAVKIKLDFDSLPPIKCEKTEEAGYLIKIHPSDQDLDQKIDLVDRMVISAREHGKNINNILGRYGELHGQKILTNSDGSVIDWEFELIDLRCLVTSKTGEGNLVYGASSFGGTRGLEIFDLSDYTPEIVGKRAGTNAKEQLKAKACPAGRFRTLTENHLTGVLAHESFGHLSEGDFVSTGANPLSNKIGERLGTDHVTIVDNGVPDIGRYGGLWLPYDDQGMKGNETIIVDKGILRHYLHNRGTAKYLGQQPTGNSRALHYGFCPIPRMTNTYFMPGELTEEEALEQLGTGVYAIQTAGGQVGGDGNFVFKAIRGYWVEQGEIKYPLREVSLSGNILELLAKVEGATKELELYSGYFGGCGKAGQHPLPVGDGGPKLLFSEVTFGGQA